MNYHPPSIIFSSWPILFFLYSLHPTPFPLLSLGCVLSRIWLFVTPWTAVLQPPLSSLGLFGCKSKSCVLTEVTPGLGILCESQPRCPRGSSWGKGSTRDSGKQSRLIKAHDICSTLIRGWYLPVYVEAERSPWGLMPGLPALWVPAKASKHCPLLVGSGKNVKEKVILLLLLLLSRFSNSPGQTTGVGSFPLLQGIFPNQGLNPGLPHCRWFLYQLSHKGSPRILKWVSYPFSRGSSRPRNQTGVFCIAGRFFTNWTIREAQWDLKQPAKHCSPPPHAEGLSSSTGCSADFSE